MTLPKMFQATIVLALSLNFCSITFAGSDKPAECVFPFTYLGREFNECTDLNGGRPWCSKTKVYNGNWAYCAKTVGDLITNDHFLDILEQMKSVEKRLKVITDAKSASSKGCGDCMKSFEDISKWINTQKNIFLDQNKRIQGIHSRIDKLLAIKKDLKKYRQRRHCRTTSGGDYLGTKARSTSGVTCQAWGSQSPNRHSYTQDSMFPDNKVSRAKNFCRNPNNAKQPWCYLTKGRYGYCEIPICNVHCKIDEDAAGKLPLCDAYPDMTCPSGYIYYKTRCYKAVSASVNWQEAENRCKKEGSHLVSISGYSENRFVASLIRNKNRYWIGANDMRHEGKWVWSDGNKFINKFWHSGEPNNYSNEDCLVLNWWRSSPWAWNDLGCNSRASYICARSATK